MNDQITLALYTCAAPDCGIEIEYRGYGRPPRWCDEHYPSRAPRRKPIRSHEVPAGISGESRARLTDPITSHEAAASVTPGAVEARILAAFDQFGWLNCSECAEIIDAYLPTVVSAVSRLRRAGELVDTGTKRLSSRGRRSIVWSRP